MVVSALNYKGTHYFGHEKVVKHKIKISLDWQC